jgi:hypothetical protein
MTHWRFALWHIGSMLCMELAALAAFGQPATERLLPFSLNSPTFLAPSLWRDGENAAGLCAVELPTQGRVGTAFAQRNGTFRRPQEPLSVSTLRFFSEGAQRFGNWTTHGTLHYERRLETDVRWSNVHDAYRGTPFIWADSVGGDWQKDLVAFSAALGSPIFLDMVSVGLVADYDVGQGARQSGARPLFRTRNFRLLPSFAFHLSPSFHFGLSATYLSCFEEGEFGASDVSFPQLIYLRGLGTANSTVLNSAERRTLGEGFGFGLQAQGLLSTWQGSLGISFLVRQDSTQDLAFVPELNRTAFRFAGRYDERQLTLTLAARHTHADFGAEVCFRGKWREGRGTDPIFLAVNTIDQLQDVSVAVDGWQGSSQIYAPLSFGIHASLSLLSRRDILAETDWQRTLLCVQAALGTAQPLSTSFIVLAHLSGGAGFVTASSYAALRPLTLTPILVRPDFLVSAANRFWLALRLALETPIAALGNSTARLVLQGGLLQSNAQLESGERLNARNHFNAGLELIF